jgi:hypothetical protein
MFVAFTCKIQHGQQIILHTLHIVLTQMSLKRVHTLTLHAWSAFATLHAGVAAGTLGTWFLGIGTVRML